MTPQSDPAFEIKKALDREVGRRFNADRFHGLDLRKPLDSRADRGGPLARIPVPIQWLGIAAALIAATTGLRSLYLDLAGRESRPAQELRAEALAPQPELEAAPGPALEQVVEPPRERRPPAPPEPRVQRPADVTPPVKNDAAPIGGAPEIAAEPTADPPETVAQAVPGPAVAVAPEPPKVVERKSERARPEPAVVPQYGVVGGGVAHATSGGVRLASFSSDGRRLMATVREAPAVGATIVSLVGAPESPGEAGASETEARAKAATIRPTAQESYYIRLLSGTKDGLAAERESAVLLSKALFAEPPPESEEVWGSERHKGFLRGAFDLKTVAAVAGVRTAAPNPFVAAKADLVAQMGGGVYRLMVTAEPSEAEGQHRFQVRLTTRDSGRLQAIEGSLVVDNNRVVVLALPDPRRMRWGGGMASSGATVFVILSPRFEDPDQRLVADKDLEPPILIDGPEPRFPGEARGHQAVGKVVLKVMVREDGSVEDPQLLEAPDVPDSRYLVEAAIDAVLERRYLPARRAGEPVDAYVTITIEFKEGGSDGQRAP